MSIGNSTNGVYYTPQAGVDAAAREGILAAQQGSHAASEALRRTGEATADAVQRGSKVAGEAVRRNAEAMAEGQREVLQTAAQQLQQANYAMAETAKGVAETMRVLIELPNAAAGGLQDLQRGMTGFVESVLQVNLRAAQSLVRLANPAGVVDAQQRFMREYVDAFLQGAATLVRATRRTADEALRPLEQQIEQSGRAARS